MYPVFSFFTGDTVHMRVADPDTIKVRSAKSSDDMYEE